MARKTKLETEQTRRQLIDAARRVFAERGVSRTSLEQIAAEAGVTRGAVYWHFENKADIFLALRDDVVMPMVEMLQQVLAEDSAGNPLDAIEHFLLAHIDRFENDPATRETFEVMMNKCEYTGEFGKLLQCVMKKRQDGIERLESAYQRAHDAGLMRAGLDPRAMALDTYAFLFGLVRLWVGHGNENPFRPQVRGMIRNHVALRRIG